MLDPQMVAGIVGWPIIGGGPKAPEVGRPTIISKRVAETATAEGECVIRGTVCVDFKTPDGKRWAQAWVVVFGSEAAGRKWSAENTPLVVEAAVESGGYFIPGT